jgi:hypothetical protein
VLISKGELPTSRFESRPNLMLTEYFDPYFEPLMNSFIPYLGHFKNNPNVSNLFSKASEVNEFQTMHGTYLELQINLSIAGFGCRI